VAELAKPGKTILVERSGTLLAEHAPPAAPTRMDYPNERAALAIFRKRITELVINGWQLGRGDTDIGGPVAVEPRLERELAAHLEPAQLAVYNDWLIERGDPCGELAALRSRGVPTTELETARGYELFGCLADLLVAMPAYRPTLEPQWTHGWIEGWLLDRLNLGTLVAYALQAPMGRFARRLIVRFGCHAPTLRYALARSSRRDAIHTLELAERGMATHLLGALPALETLAMPGGETCDGHPQVRTLALQIAAGRTTQLISGAWPALERLTIRAPKISGTIVAKLVEDAPLEKLRALRHVDVDAELDASSLDRIRTRLSGFTT
jgi:hypothetical protein